LISSALPFSFRRRMLEGMVSICMLIVFVFILNEENKKKMVTTFIKICMTITYSFGTLYFYFADIPVHVKEMRNDLNSTYITKDDNDTLKYFQINHITRKNILADYHLSIWIPAETFNKVYLGHYAETTDTKDKIYNFRKI